MSPGKKAIVLLALLAGIAVCVRMLALGRETVWMPLLSGSAARLVFRSLTIALGLAPSARAESAMPCTSGRRR